MPFVGISLGSNLGDRLGNLRSAVEFLKSSRSSPHLLASSVYETAPVGCPPGSEPFYNAVIEIETVLSPLELLSRTQAIEHALGDQQTGRSMPLGRWTSIFSITTTWR